MSRIGYKRVSTKEQNLDRQELPDCDEVYTDTASGKDTERPEFQAMMAYVRKGDTLVCYSPDRISRSLQDLIQVVNELGDKEVSIEFVTGPLANMDLSTAEGKLMLRLMASLAEYERDLMLKRQAEGIAKAKERGVYQGRKATIDPRRVKELLEEGVGASEAARMLGISRQSVYRLSKA